ncbi:MAG TPA: squalene/phytoene synthase family protein [Gemmatimonadota bacterium]|nr:squalene/phytoene synthase family protein [Gemmatimonadota bacterium]
MSGADAVEAGYARCLAETRRRAANFGLGIRLLPRERRRALSAVYWFSQRADDAADGDGPPGERRFRLETVRTELDRTLAGDPPSSSWAALADASSRFRIAHGLYRELLDGVGRDLDPSPYPDWGATLAYCYGVAGTVGLISLPIFGVDEADGENARRDAIDLGAALQITNILRDLREDARRGRWYLPLDLSDRYGVHPEGVAAGRPGPGFEALVLAAAETARPLYGAARRLSARLPRSTRACPVSLAAVYRGLLERIAADPAAVLRERVRVPGPAKAARAFGASLIALAR